MSDFIQQHPENVICNPLTPLPQEIDGYINDGIVNTACQLVDPKSTIGGFVVADHADVMGHYDQQDALVEGTVLNAGLFHSGAGFGDDQFFKFYEGIANAILQRIPQARKRRVDGSLREGGSAKIRVEPDRPGIVLAGRKTAAGPLSRS